MSNFKQKQIPWHKRTRYERQIALFYPDRLNKEDRSAVEACTDWHKPPKLLGTYDRGSLSPLGGDMKFPTPTKRR